MKKEHAAKKTGVTRSRAPATPAGGAAATKPRRNAPASKPGLAEVMSALEKAGTAQNRKTYTRHGAVEPMFGVSFAELAQIRKRIGADHDLASALWDTGNHDARVLALKVADPARVTRAELCRWAAQVRTDFLHTYVAQLAAESPHGPALARDWIAAPDDPGAGPAWAVVGQLALTDVATPDAWFADRLGEIARGIHSAPNARRAGMNRALIAIGCRSAALRKAATAAAKRIGKVVVDHGDTSCKTPDAAEYIEKTWAHSTSKGFESPAAHERSREPVRIRC